MRIWKLISALMVVAMLASIMGMGGAQGATASESPPQPKVDALALPFAWVDTAFPVLVIVRNQADSAIDDPQICIDVPDGCVLELPEDECVEPWFGIRAKRYSFAIWFVSCPFEDVIEIEVCVMGDIDEEPVYACDSVEIEVWD